MIELTWMYVHGGTSTEKSLPSYPTRTSHCKIIALTAAGATAVKVTIGRLYRTSLCAQQHAVIIFHAASARDAAPLVKGMTAYSSLAKVCGVYANLICLYQPIEVSNPLHPPWQDRMHVPSDWTVNIGPYDAPTVKPIYVDGGTSPSFNRTQDRSSRTTNPLSSQCRVKSESHTAQHRPSSHTKGSVQQGSQQRTPRTGRVWTQINVQIDTHPLNPPCFDVIAPT